LEHDGLLDACRRARIRAADWLAIIENPRRSITVSFTKSIALAAFLLIGSLVNATAQKALPEAIAVPGETPILTLHAEGAQVYECKSGGDGTLTWAFREPIATLFQDGKTVGRHYAGPNWEFSDGSAVVGQVAGTAPGMVANDIPLLKLTVTSRRGNGVLSPATTVQRINTAGGRLNGTCYKAGTYESVPYSADYVFLRKG
jgi:Protein of unknown function (DUF3455)